MLENLHDGPLGKSAVLWRLFGSKNDCLKAAYSVTMNIFRKFLFSFYIICKSRIKLCFYNKNVQYS